MKKKFYGDNRQHFSVFQKIDMRLWFFHPKVLFSRSARVFLPRDFLGIASDTKFSSYAGNKFLSLAEGTDVIINTIEKGEPALFGRFGDTELFACCDFDIRGGGVMADQNFYRLQANSGYFYQDEKREADFYKTYMNAFKNADALGCWFTIGEDYMIKKYNPKLTLMPLETYEPWHNPENPWSKCLKGKKVLVISPFTRTIEQQWKKRELLFNGTEILPDFDLITYKAVNTRGDAIDDRFSDWHEALTFMVKEISEIEFDIAIAGCGAYTLPILSEVKNMGKIGIQMGGATQLLFGIIGNRWENDPYVSKYRNDNWCRILPIDMAEGMDKADKPYT